jgi:hypothetical protein
MESRSNEDCGMTEHRWSKFWWADYEGDDALRVVSLAAQGLWMRMLCVMHKGTPYGHLTINGQPPTDRQIGMLASVSEGKTKKLVQELEKSGVFSRTETGVIFCRRMVRDKEISEQGQRDGKRGGNPTLKLKVDGGLTPPVIQPPYALEAEAEADTEADKKGESAPRSASSPTRTGARLPDAWIPDEPGFEGATQQTLAKFRDYWRAQPGARGRKTDWQATWRNWCRRDAESRTRAPPAKTSHLSTYDQNEQLIRLARDTEPQLRLAQ